MGSGPIGAHQKLIDALGKLDGIRDRGKVHPAFHFKSRAFLHFHHDERGAVYADVRFNDDWERVPAESPAERAALLNRVSAHVSDRRR